MTQQQIEEKLKSLETSIKTLSSMDSMMMKFINERIKLSDLVRSEESMKILINDSNIIIRRLEEQLAMISTPEQTRFYLEKSEVENFRSNFNQLLAMMAQFEELYKNLVAYSAVK